MTFGYFIAVTLLPTAETHMPVVAFRSLKSQPAARAGLAVD